MKPIKKIIKKSLASLLFFDCSKIVVASTGRAGSTMLHGAIIDSLIQDRFKLRPDNFAAEIIKRVCAGYLDRIHLLHTDSCHVCKTHDLYQRPPSDRDKYVFIYGDPLESAMSVEKITADLGQEWFATHQYHLKARGRFEDLYHKDVLNYRGQIEHWLTQDSENVICIDYDDLWDESKRLSRFLGFQVHIPPRIPRQAKMTNRNVNEQFFNQLRDLKDALKKQYNFPC